VKTQSSSIHLVYIRLMQDVVLAGRKLNSAEIITWLYLAQLECSAPLVMLIMSCESAERSEVNMVVAAIVSRYQQH